MAIVLNSNLLAQQAIRNLSKSTDTSAEIFERLSSGLRVNRAADDAAGLAVASGLDTRVRVYSQAVRNANDTISLLNVAQGASESLSDITIRLKELAGQAANGTLTLTQRKSLNSEAYALTNEFNRLVNSTKFNNMNILTADSGRVVTQLGYGSGETIGANSADDLRRNAGAGTVGSATNTGNIGAGDLCVADFNGDGQMDIASIAGGTTTVQLKLGNGDGTFSSAADLIVNGTNISRLVAADFNGDGVTDLAAGDANGHVITTRWSGGGLTVMTDTAVVSGAVATLQAADLNRDGKIDVVAGTASFPIASALGNGAGGLTVGWWTSNAVAQSSSAQGQIGDINGDGIPDLVTSAANVPLMSVYLGKGDGSFAFQSNSLSVGKNGCFVLRDFNRDGCDDILGATGVLAISNNGVFSSTSNAWAPVGTGPIVASDFNNDGYLDIMRIESAATISFNFGNGDGTFGATTQTAGSSTFALAAGDFNGDGVVDGAYGTAANTEVRLANTTQNTWIQHFDLLTQSGARQALSDLDSTLLRVNKNLASMGASMSRLGSALNTLSATRDNYTAARSRIMDVDVAAEAAQMVRNQVLQQSASALLAQANQQPSLVLQLLN